MPLKKERMNCILKQPIRMCKTEKSDTIHWQECIGSGISVSGKNTR
jgi:hypothetical protein